MIQASRTQPARPPVQTSLSSGLSAGLSPALVRRRRPLMLAPPAAYLRMPVVPIEVVEEPAGSRWQDDLRFFLGCYVAGLVFFLIMLS